MPEISEPKKSKVVQKYINDAFNLNEKSYVADQMRNQQSNCSTSLKQRMFNAVKKQGRQKQQNHSFLLITDPLIKFKHESVIEMNKLKKGKEMGKKELHELESSRCSIKSNLSV